jgi:hypothetical protein
MYESNWHINDTYSYLDEFGALGAPAFAWEHLRRNLDYRIAYRSLASKGDTTSEMSERVAQRWGLHFMTDPVLPADRAHVAWLWHLNPATVVVAPAPDEFTEALPINELTPAFSRRTADGLHWVLGQGGDALQVALIDGANTDRPAAFVIPLDNCPEMRIEAVLRFWEAMTGHVSVRKPDGLTAQQRSKLKLILRALDGRLAGCSYRAIAEVLFGPSSVPAGRNWAHDNLRCRTRRLCQRGSDLMHGEYLDLMRYPLQFRG